MMCEFFRIEGFAMTNITNGKQSNYSFNNFNTKISATVWKRNRAFYLISALTTCWLILASANVIGQSTREYTYSGGKLTGVRIETKAAILHGDVNDDGKVDGMDLMMMRLWLTGWSAPEFNVDSADLNDDGKVDGMDLMIMRLHLTGWPGYETLPIKP